MIRDRIRELRRVPASELVPHPRNWRTHPDGQRKALQAVLAEVGFADALLVRELADGRLGLIDGHLRAETIPDMQVPVLVLDVDDREAEKILATYDPLAAMAEADRERATALLADIEFEDEKLGPLLESQLAAEHSQPPMSAEHGRLDEVFQVLVECEDEAQQRELFERLAAEGHVCRVLTL